MTSTFRRRQFLASGAAAAGLLACDAAMPAMPRGTLRFGLSGYPPSFNAWAQSGTAAGTLKLLTHRGLLSYGTDGRLRAELARSWDVDPSGTWTFRLRRARFHDGRPVTSADVLATIERVAAPDSTAYLQGQLRQIVDADAPDNDTIRIRTADNVATLPNWFAHFNLPILPRDAAPDDPAGAGPFRLTGVERGVSMRLERHDRYYRRDLPLLDAIEVIVYADEHLRVAALEAGDVDLIDYVPWQSMQRIRGNSRLALDAVDGPFMYLTFNGNRPPFDDPRVRRAVAIAVKREEIVDGAFFGHGSPLAHLPIAESSAYFNPQHVDGWQWDPEKARSLLREAGYENGFACDLLATSQYGMHQHTAEIVQFHLASIGIDARLRLSDWPTRVQQGNAGHYDIAVMGTTTDSNDPDGLTDILDSTLPPSFTRSVGISIPAIDQALKAGRIEFDAGKRRRIYADMEAAALQFAPIVCLTWRSQGYAMQRGLRGFVNLPGQLTGYSGITLEDARYD